ncbi:CapA family protein [Patescibacteria group bacterium]|nr:CapA family protein [Patescibacteria group bacterium]MBU1921689.1 CapA family protein [Patescibacteria group bacterium]
MKKFSVILVCVSFSAVTAVAFVLESFKEPVYYSGERVESAVQEAEGQDETEQNQEFEKFKAIREKLPQTEEEVSLIAVGDIMLSRDVATKIYQHNDVNYSFLDTRDYLKTADLVFGNLETPITPGRRILSYEMVFRADPGVENAMRDANFSVLSLANNHTLNFGADGLTDTFDYLTEAGILYSGAGAGEARAWAPVFVETKGIKFAFLSYAQSNFVPAAYRVGTGPIVAAMDKEKMASAVAQAKERADFVIVSMHAGAEYVAAPNRTQTDFARAAVDAGADLVLGHHPHVVESVEIYKGKYIFYSLGNFVFDQMWSYQTQRGLAVKAFFNKWGVSKIELVPVLIENYAKPKILTADQGADILARLGLGMDERICFSWDGEKNDFTQNNRKIFSGVGASYAAAADKLIKLDSDKDGVAEEYLLKNGRFRVKESYKIIWQSPQDWWVDDFALADSTGDGKVDINLSVWKSGSFGASKPFWIEEDDPSVKNHLFVYDYINNEVVPIWQSSNLDQPNCEFDFQDIDNDGNEELVVIEGEYAEDFICEGKHVAVWQWNGWGFSLVWRSPAGDYADLQLEKINGAGYILSDAG